MVDRIRAGLDNDHEKYARFKDVSAQYRHGGIDAETYLVYVDQFGLSHLVLDLARLLPDPHKERELIAVYNANRPMSGLKGNDKKNKGKSVANNKNSTNKYGYRAANKGKLKVEADDRTSPGGQLVIKPPKSEGGNVGGGDGEGKSKHRKKTSKFLRVRLGNGSLASLDLNDSNGGSDGPLAKGESGGKADQETADGIAMRGVWRNGGGHRLIVSDQKDHRGIPNQQLLIDSGPNFMFEGKLQSTTCEL
ncbi:hypothetical protein L1987_21757 [Smallanthus sonchifolius]|uniref:Uncharacterized protein n=1 Tax=Smallanthus sonchifolius TaxID=185202 RepID=A0ACB9IEF2_9ASTR|nr:hypothetical protein L1987_21757 [Smallanthus sonchifolius]